MKPLSKVFILSFTLLLPISIYLFLRFFGVNKYDLPSFERNNNLCIQLFEDEPIINNYSLENIKILDYRISDNDIIVNNLLNRLYQKKNINIITLSNKKQNVEWVSYMFGNDIILNFIRCEYIEVHTTSFLVLYDDDNQIRGYYSSDDPKEYERLDVEIDILKSNYEK